MSSTYEKDFHRWTQEQADFLKTGKLGALDLSHLAEEIEGVGASERREIRNRLKSLLTHLLKWEYQSEKRTRSWLATIAEQRDGIASVIADSPSLATFPSTILDDCYFWALRHFEIETGLPGDRFPQTCPYPIDKVDDPDFLPGSPTQHLVD